MGFSLVGSLIIIFLVLSITDEILVSTKYIDFLFYKQVLSIVIVKYVFFLVCETIQVMHSFVIVFTVIELLFIYVTSTIRY
jgi:hypothetical protein